MEYEVIEEEIESSGKLAKSKSYKISKKEGEQKFSPSKKQQTLQEGLKSSLKLFMDEETKAPPRLYVYGTLSSQLHLSTLPEEVSKPENRTVKVASVGVEHAFLLLDNGVLLYAGNNDFG